MSEPIRKVRTMLFDDHRKLNPDSEDGVCVGTEKTTLADLREALKVYGMIAMPVEPVIGSMIDTPFDALCSGIEYYHDSFQSRFIKQAYNAMIKAAQEQSDDH